MDTKEQLVRKIIEEMRGYIKRIAELLSILDGKKVVRADERVALQAMAAALKDDLKAAAKRGTITTNTGPQTQPERAFFAPAVQSAAARFRVAVNSHPIRSNWYGCLYEVQMDINFYLHQLEEMYPVSSDLSR
jgi:hypothetical protein